MGRKEKKDEEGRGKNDSWARQTTEGRYNCELHKRSINCYALVSWWCLTQGLRQKNFHSYSLAHMRLPQVGVMTLAFGACLVHSALSPV